MGDNISREDANRIADAIVKKLNNTSDDSLVSDSLFKNRKDLNTTTLWQQSQSAAMDKILSGDGADLSQGIYRKEAVDGYVKSLETLSSKLKKVKDEAAGIKETMASAFVISNVEGFQKKLDELTAKQKEYNELVHASANAELNSADFEDRGRIWRAQQEQANKTISEARRQRDDKLAEARELYTGENLTKAINEIKTNYNNIKTQALAGVGDFSTMQAALSDFMGGQSLSGSVVESISTAIPGVSAAMGVLGVIAEKLSYINKYVSEGVTSAVNLQSQYLGKINDRLATSTTSTQDFYNTLIGGFVNNFSTGYVNQQNMVKHIGELVEAGIATDIEQRAILMEVADRIASTFNALDASLTRTIRLQGVDSTQAAMGVNSELNAFLTGTFGDSSYLKDAYSNVTAAILDASSQMSADASTSFNYAVQKWLGALYSVGLSQSGVNTLAQGINFLGTGNVNSLNGNDSMQTLLALAAKNAGLSYEGMLTKGITAGDVNSLMSALVNMMGSANSDTNNVLKSAWGNITGLSYSDLQAMQNLTRYDLQSISGNGLGFDSAAGIITNELNTLGSRTPYATQLTNIKDNLIYSLGQNIVGDKSDFLWWTLADLLPGSLGNLVQGAVTLFDKSSWQSTTGAIKSLASLVGRDSDIAGIAALNAYLGNYTERFTGNTYTPGVAKGTSSYVTTTGGTPFYTPVSEMSSYSTMSTQGEVVRSATDIYYELFENQQHPVRISLARVEDRARDELDIKSLTLLANLAENSGIRADIIESDVTALQNISSVAGTVRVSW